ncbi:MAG: hypothetical protein KME14_14305 [Tildeniella torsiva UHER 1998/13D]|jgi:hypothetical protein|nr:hypothetical protein [Tildeniella torsiva UHER 1998/13D]
MFAQTFRNTLVASSLLIGASLLAGPAALAQSSDGVSGDVQAVNTVTFTGAENTSITGGTGQSAYTIGTLAIQSNDPDGWELDVKSANGGELVNGSYDITYNDLTTAAITGATINLVDVDTADTDEEVIDAIYDIDVANAVSVSVTANLVGEYVPAGTYSDTLTFTITGK